jgi:hypothetical protein
MRWNRQLLFGMVAVGLMATGVRSWASEELLAEPQHAVVTSPGAPVRSGPGDSFYLTDTLPQETAVEVYRKRSDGWCAIRPPAESFSWVFGQHVTLVDDGLAEIGKEDVAARVGSRLSSQRDVVQVRLRKGEKVAVLARDEREGGEWFKIAPPAGEFRWVHAKDIGLADAAVEVNGEVAEGVVAEGKVKTVAHEQPADNRYGNVTAPPLAPVETVPVPMSAANAGPQSQPNVGQWAPAKAAPPTGDVTPIGSAPAASGSLAAQLNDLELRLSRMVAEQPGTWNVASLEQSAEQLLKQCDSISDREAVKATLAKIDRFAAIQRRYGAGNGTIAANAANANVMMNGMTATSVAAVPAGSDPATGAASPYDAVGTLRPVVSRRPGAPQFALVNAQGQVITFVTPSPDVNLQPYIGQQIGVTGSRGYIPEFRRAHVTAGRVTPIDGRVLR